MIAYRYCRTWQRAISDADRWAREDGRRYRVQRVQWEGRATWCVTAVPAAPSAAPTLPVLSEAEARAGIWGALRAHIPSLSVQRRVQLSILMTRHLMENGYQLMWRDTDRDAR